MRRNGILFPEFTSCFWLFENVSWHFFGTFNDVFAPPKTRGISFSAFQKFEVTHAIKTTLGFLHNLVRISEAGNVFQNRPRLFKERITLPSG